jgi:hypothetical protein
LFLPWVECLLALPRTNYYLLLMPWTNYGTIQLSKRHDHQFFAELYSVCNCHGVLLKSRPLRVHTWIAYSWCLTIVIYWIQHGHLT